MENSGINPIPNNLSPVEYFAALVYNRPQSVEDCNKRKREAAKVFKNLMAAQKKSIQKIKINELSIVKMFQLQYESNKLSTIQDLYLNALNFLDVQKERLRNEEKVKTEALNRLYKKDVKP